MTPTNPPEAAQEKNMDIFEGDLTTEAGKVYPYTAKAWKGGNYEAGAFLSKLKDLKLEDGFGELDIYCECGWFSEERGATGVSALGEPPK